jgi:hypothetical protein
MIPIIKKHLYANDDDDAGPVAMLLLGSARDDWEMGQIAVSKLTIFWVKRILLRYGDYQSFFDKLRPAWRQKLMELVLFTTLDNGKLYLDWRSISDEFVPPPQPPASPAPVAAADKRKSK